MDGFIPLNPHHRGLQGRAGWVTDSNGCDIWQGARNAQGYGVGWDSTQRKVRLVHRLRYEREIGPIPEGMPLDHFACDNGAGGCCNPRHCRPASHRENVLRADSISARAAAATHCTRGHPYSGDNLLIRRDGSRTCRACMKMWSRANYQRHRDSHGERTRAYHRANRDALLAHKRAHREANKDRINARQREARRAKKLRERHMMTTPPDVL